MPCYSTVLNLKLRKFLGKTKMTFVGINPHHTFKVFMQKNLEATLLFVDSSKALDSILRGKMEQILAYGLHRETVAAIMMLNRNMKVQVRSPD